MMVVTQDVPDTPLGRIDKTYHWIESALNYVAATFLFCLMLTACAEVFMRYFVGRPIHGQADFVEIAIPVMGFFGLAYCQRLSGHVRMEIVLKALKGRWYWAFEFVSNFVTIIIIGCMIYGSFLHFQRAFENGDTSMDAEIAIWPFKLIVFLGFCVLFIRLIISFFGYIRLLVHPEAVPIGVPVQPSIQDLAEAEAESARDAIDDDEVERATGYRARKEDV